VPRKAKDDDQDEDEPSSFRKVLYCYMAFTLLHAEFSSVLNRINSIERDKQKILRRLMIARKFTNSPSIFVAAQMNPKRQLGSCNNWEIDPRYANDDGIVDVLQYHTVSSGTEFMTNDDDEKEID
jgi:hypothetical protein